jgi:hypothetical protein
MADISSHSAPRVRSFVSADLETNVELVSTVRCANRQAAATTKDEPKATDLFLRLRTSLLVPISALEDKTWRMTMLRFWSESMTLFVMLVFDDNMGFAETSHERQVPPIRLNFI